MFGVVRIVAAGELSLTLLEGLFPQTLHHLLPLAGSQAAQIGILFGATYVACECCDGGIRLYKRCREWLGTRADH